VPAFSSENLFNCCMLLLLKLLGIVELLLAGQAGLTAAT
jgi:hypothetical protein